MRFPGILNFWQSEQSQLGCFMCWSQTDKLWCYDTEPDRSMQPGSHNLAWPLCAAKLLPGKLHCAGVQCQQGSFLRPSFCLVEHLRGWEGAGLCFTSPPRAVEHLLCQCPAYSSSLFGARWALFCYWSCSTLCRVVSFLVCRRKELMSRACGQEWGEVGFRFCFGEW